MVTTELSPRPASAGERLQHLAGMAVFRLVGVWRAVQNRRAVAKLLEWDDRALRDIGLTQGDVRSAMAGPVVEDPSARLATMSGERRAAVRALAREQLSRRGPRKGEVHRQFYPFRDL
jgi:uncharacterized protein YjiS (DUF1127 family)